MRLNMYDSQQALSFLTQQATMIEAEVYRIQYPEIQYANLIPIDTSGGDARKSTVLNMMLMDVGGPLRKAGAYRSRYLANDTPTFGCGSIVAHVEPSYCLHCVSTGRDGSTTTSPMTGWSVITMVPTC